MQPVFASREYTVPFWLPTKSRPAATVGCDHADVASGNPNDHLSASRGTCSSVRPASAVDWNLVLEVDGDQPLQDDDAAGFGSGGVDAHRPIEAPVMSPPSAFPLRYWATLRRSIPLKRPPCGRMPPAVSAFRIASGDRCRRTSRAGAREPAAPS